MPNQETKRLLVFISHANEDNAAAKRLYKRLKEDGFDPWLDEERLLPGQNWGLEIEKALRASDVILLCFSEVSIAKSGYIQREYKRAMDLLEEKPEGAIFIIPIRFDECEMPNFIRELHWMDYPADYDKLLLSLQSRSGGNTKRKKSILVKKNKQVQLVLEGKFEEFDETRQDDLISVLAAILKVDSENIRVLQVHAGSIILILEMPESATYSLQGIANKGDFRLKAIRILSIQVEGEKIISLTDESHKKSKKTSSESRNGNIFHVQGGIHVGRDFVDGNQVNYINNSQVINNISTPVQFIEELQQLKAEIERLKSLPDVEPAAARRLTAVEGDIQEAIIEAEKDQPVAERINNTLDGAKETMEKLGGSIGAAVGLGTTLGSLALLALKLFGG